MKLQASKLNLSLLLFALVLTMSSCSKQESCEITEENGVKYYKNKNTPANSGLKFVIDDKIVLKGGGEDSLRSFNSVSDLTFDKDGNIYLFENRKQRVIKYDKKGNYLLNFSKRGNGPGEIDGAADFAITGDSLTLLSPRQAKVNIFDLNGNFGESRLIKIPGLYYGIVDRGIGDDEILGFNPTFDATGNKLLIGNELVIKDRSYRKKQVFHTIPADKDPKDIAGAKIIFMPFAYHNGLIYFAPDFPEKYEINVKDKQSNLKSVITKFARKIAFNPEEKKHYEETSGFSWNGQKIIPNDKFKVIINKIFTDKYGHLITWVSKERKSGIKHHPYLEIFKDGIFQKGFEFQEIELVDTNTGTDIVFNFIKDKLVIFDYSQTIVTIYDYHYE